MKQKKSASKITAKRTSVLCATVFSSSCCSLRQLACHDINKEIDAEAAHLKRPNTHEFEREKEETRRISWQSVCYYRLRFGRHFLKDKGVSVRAIYLFWRRNLVMKSSKKRSRRFLTSTFWTFSHFAKWNSSDSERFNSKFQLCKIQKVPDYDHLCTRSRIVR